MKSKIITLASFVFMLLTLNLNANATTFKPPYKKTAHAKISSSLYDLKKNLEYDFSRSLIRNVYYDKLDQLAKYLIDKNAALALRGYADSIGNFKSNWNLSEKRAVVVKDYLVKKGVADNKIVTTPFGSTKPIATNKTAEGRQKNRRVEIKITDPENN